MKRIISLFIIVSLLVMVSAPTIGESTEDLKYKAQMEVKFSALKSFIGEPIVLTNDASSSIGDIGTIGLSINPANYPKQMLLMAQVTETTQYAWLMDCTMMNYIRAITTMDESTVMAIISYTKPNGTTKNIVYSSEFKDVITYESFKQDANNIRTEAYIDKIMENDL